MGIYMIDDKNGEKHALVSINSVSNNIHGGGRVYC